MNFSELKATLSLSVMMVVGYDDGGDNGVACLTVARIEDNGAIKILKCVHGQAAETMYLALN